MRKEPILTALDAEGQLVRIDDAVHGGRYTGATQDHQDCELFPVFRSANLDSFAHLPSQEHVAAHRRGQSAAHRRACSDWHELLQKLLGDCGLCKLMVLEVDDHICPARDISGKLTLREGAPMFGEIVWVCDKCLRVHVWDLLADNATTALRERQAPGLSIRPDITILDRHERPICFIEFHASHLSAESKKVAERKNIPLFVVDVERTVAEFQMGLQNPLRGMWQAVANVDGILLTDSQVEEHRRMDEMEYRFTESVGQEGGVSSSFSPIPDDTGNLADVHFHAAGHSPALPMPSIGHYLMANWSNLGCDSQKRWLGGTAL